MEYSKLGRSDIMVSRITHGCMELGGGFGGLNWKVEEKETNIRLLRLALEKGINTFDTAEVYGNGNSERIVGEALQGVRSRCIIATKVSPEHLDQAGVRTATENSLKRLGTEYIDLVYIHWPNSLIPMEETMEAFGKLRREGKIRAIGVSNFGIAELTKAHELIDVDALQIEYNLLEQEGKEELLAFCKEKQTSVFCYNSVAKGILTGAFHFDGKVLAPDDFRNLKPLFSSGNLEAERPLLLLLKDVAGRLGISVSQASLAWLLADSRISAAIVGTQKEGHLMDNIEAGEVHLPEEDRKRLNEVSLEVIASLV